ncbi:MAG: nucleotide exchange factor GrpE [Deltaproteobacteria bacterium]|jgi:molecular chaperone GrpE|nr:nucleotide exchange factor GrpE [Deltaproteobacteria bacterium]
MDDFTKNDFGSPSPPENTATESTTPENSELPREDNQTFDTYTYDNFGNPQADIPILENVDSYDSEEELEDEFIDWRAECQLYKEKFLRALADHENARRRHEKELTSARQYGTEAVLREVILVLENLYLALSYADSNDPSVKALADGVSMTIKDCLNKLGDYGFKELKASPGDIFDPNYHEVMGQEADPRYPNGTITKVLSRGYALRDRLLKPIKVLVAKNTANPEGEAS